MFAHTANLIDASVVILYRQLIKDHNLAISPACGLLTAITVWE